MQYTDKEFAKLSWHDCHIWGIEIRAGDPDERDWTSDLVLHIDFIVEWICGTDGQCEFRIAPAELVFHDVTDLSISICWSERDAQAAIHPISIEAIERDLIEGQRVYLDRAYYRWRIGLNWPEGGQITFGAMGYTQTLVSEPQLSRRQHLTLSQRLKLRSLGR